MDEEIEAYAIPSTPIVSSPMPQFTAEEAGVEELEDEDVDIRSTTPVMNDNFWESQPPNSSLFTPLQQIHHSPSPTVQIGSEDTHLAASVNEEIPAPSAEETAAATENVTAPEENLENPHPEEPELVIPEVVMQLTDTPLPRPKDPFSRKQKSKAEDLFGEHVFFTDYNPYDSARIRKRRFWTASQANFYSVVLFNKDKVFDHAHIPHVDMESLPCFEPVLSVLHDAGLLNFCTDICDWNEELILQFYATLHITGDSEDVNSWVFDWMSENTHHKAPASELLRALPLSPPTEDARCIYNEPELSNHYMQVLMKPLKPGQAPRTNFLVKELLYVPRTVYRILTKTMSPIKGHDSSDEEVVGIMKNLLFNIIHGVPVNFHDFFMRTLANIAMSPFKLKPYAPWIMKFIRIRSSLNYKPETLNHCSYLPPIEVLKRTFSSAEEKGKATVVIDEGIRPLDGQFRKAASYSTNDDSATHDSAANTAKQNPQATAPRVMTDRELLLSFHQKVDRNHKWVKRQFGSILHNMTATHNAVKKNHYYLHGTLNRTWDVLSQVYSADDLNKIGLKEDFDWFAPPPKKYKKVKVPSLVASSYSSSRATNENEDLDDTAAGPTSTTDPNNAGAPSST